jgi:hypothetical protein
MDAWYIIQKAAVVEFWLVLASRPTDAFLARAHHYFCKLFDWDNVGCRRWEKNGGYFESIAPVDSVVAKSRLSGHFAIENNCW